MKLTEFLLARIEEDEDVARDAAGWDLAGTTRAPGHWTRDGSNSVIDSQRRSVVYGDGPAPGNAQAEHIVRYDPARILAECEAKRHIVERCRPLVAVDWRESDRLLASAFDKTHMPTPAHSAPIWPNEHAEATLRDLALPYSNHPDYDEAWRP